MKIAFQTPAAVPSQSSPPGARSTGSQGAPLGRTTNHAAQAMRFHENHELRYLQPTAFAAAIPTFEIALRLSKRELISSVYASQTRCRSKGCRVRVLHAELRLKGKSV